MKLNIKETFQKSKPYENDIILIFVIICVALIAFGLGRFSAISEKKTPITIENLASTSTSYVDVKNNTDNTRTLSAEKLYVASKNGTKYHYPWCSGGQSIKEENKIWFSSKEEAEKAGYQPASNCKGL